MDKLFFFVTSSEFWKNNFDFCDNFFNIHNGFLTGLAIALGLALLLALLFYFGCANNKHEGQLATIPVWVGFLAGTFILTTVCANYILIGKSSTTPQDSMFYSHSIYKATTDYVIKKTSNNPNEDQVKKIVAQQTQFNKTLDQNGGVRWSFSLGCGVYSILFFYIISLLVKGFTYGGVAIPHLWPFKNK